jgi:hypothetical protein
MTITSWIALCISAASLIVATVVPLTIAALQRKQMRQIELHRADPSVSLIPPPHPATRFIKRNGIFIVSVIIEIAVLTKEMRQTEPITRWDVFNIALAVAALAYLILLKSSQNIYDYIFKIYDLIYKLAFVVDANKKSCDAKKPT